MNENYYEQIDAYLNGEMNAEEKSLFESALASDQELVSTYRLYRTIESEMQGIEKHSQQDDALKNTLQFLNKKYFTNIPPATGTIIPLYANKFLKITTAVAASASIILITYFNFFPAGENMQLLANTYVQENLQQISQTASVPDDTLQFGMAGTKREKNTTLDSLQLGITAYNNQDYKTALSYFAGVARNHPENPESTKYTGLVYLNSKDFDKALVQFEKLANAQDIPNNPGAFLKAITFMQRNQPGDKQKAKQLLQQVVANNSAGSQEAAQWLQKL